MLFSEVIELKSGEKLSYPGICFKVFLELWLLKSISHKYMVTHNFLFGFQCPLLRSAVHSLSYTVQNYLRTLRSTIFKKLCGGGHPFFDIASYARLLKM